MHRSIRFLTVASLALAWAGTGCSSDDKKPAIEPKPTPAAKTPDAKTTDAKATDAKTTDPRPVGEGVTSVAITEGKAGGVIESTFTATATVTAIDAPTRRVTLQAADGNKATFTVPPEVRNFAQLDVGDRVTITIVERLVAFVTRTGEEAGAAEGALLARAPKGAKPGGMVAEAYELVATIQSIDPTARTATLAFAGGETRTVNVRPDVDLARYKTGDTVIIRATAALSVITESP